MCSVPSYRTILGIGALHPGHAPQEVEANARRAHLLEAFDVGIVRGAAQVTCRFAAIDDEEAIRVHREIVAAVRLAAQVPRAGLAKVVRGRNAPIL